VAGVRLAFNPSANFAFQNFNDGVYHNVTLPVPKEQYRRRLYVLLSGSGTPSVNAVVQFTLAGRVVFEIPYLKRPAAAFEIVLPGGAVATNFAEANSIMVNYSATSYIVFPWELTIAADQMNVIINSSTIPGTAHQFVGIHSENIW